jgi:hypothetical protein
VLGAGKASNIDIVGSDVRAAGNVSLAADNQANLLAAQDAASRHRQSWSAAVGVAAELSSSGPKYGVTASASASRGNVDGEATTQVNTHVVAGERLTIASGGDTNLLGAVASANPGGNGHQRQPEHREPGGDTVVNLGAGSDLPFTVARRCQGFAAHHVCKIRR